jgi:actin-related protein
VPKAIRTKITAERNRKFASWTGAKILADLNNYNVITKKDYEDAGAKLITKIFP